MAAAMGKEHLVATPSPRRLHRLIPTPSRNRQLPEEFRPMMDDFPPERDAVMERPPPLPTADFNLATPVAGRSAAGAGAGASPQCSEGVSTSPPRESPAPSTARERPAFSLAGEQPGQAADTGEASTTEADIGPVLFRLSYSDASGISELASQLPLQPPRPRARQGAGAFAEAAGAAPPPQGAAAALGSAPPTDGASLGEERATHKDLAGLPPDLKCRYLQQLRHLKARQLEAEKRTAELEAAALLTGQRGRRGSGGTGRGRSLLWPLAAGLAAFAVGFTATARLGSATGLGALGGSACGSPEPPQNSTCFKALAEAEREAAQGDAAVRRDAKGYLQMLTAFDGWASFMRESMEADAALAGCIEATREEYSFAFAQLRDSFEVAENLTWRGGLRERLRLLRREVLLRQALAPLRPPQAPAPGEAKASRWWRR